MARNEDPLLSSGRREALVVMAIWLAAGLYTVTFCYLYGYGPAEGAGGADGGLAAAGDLRLVLGVPWWVFWGVVVPWVVSTGVHLWFAFSFMGDEDLGAEEELPPPGGEAEHERSSRPAD